MATPEQKARQLIDAQLAAAGWIVQDRDEMNLGAGLGVAVREYPLATGPCDYLLFVDRRACGVAEAKPEGTTLSGVAEQATSAICARRRSASAASATRNSPPATS